MQFPVSVDDVNIFIYDNPRLNLNINLFTLFDGDCYPIQTNMFN